jgi:hypothetical protein
MSSLKPAKMALGMSFRMNFSFPDLNCVSTPTEVIWDRRGRVFRSLVRCQPDAPEMRPLLNQLLEKVATSRSADCFAA